MNKFLSAVITLLVAVGFSACSTGEKDIPVSLDFSIQTDREIEEDATPLVLKIESDQTDKVYYRTIVPGDSDAGHVEMSLPEGDYAVTYVSPVQKDGSLYAIEGTPKMTIKPASEKADQATKLEATMTWKEPKTVTAAQIESVATELEAAYASGQGEKDKDGDTTAGITKETLEEVKELLADKKQEEQDNQAAAKAYRQILEDPKSHVPHTFANDMMTGSHEVTYALINIGETKVPQLLLSVLPKDSYGNWISYLWLFEYDLADGTIHRDEDRALTEGVASAGGFRGAFSYNAVENYFLESVFSSGTGEGKISKLVLKDHKITSLSAVECRMGQNCPEDSPDTQPIDWHDANDFGPIDALAGPAGDDESESESESEKVTDLDKLAEDEWTFVGTVRTFKSKAESIRFRLDNNLAGQGFKDEFDRGGNDAECIYFANPDVFLVFDKPKSAACKIGGPDALEREYKYMRLDKADAHLDGKKVVVTLPGTCFGASDCTGIESTFSGSDYQIKVVKP